MKTLEKLLSTSEVIDNYQLNIYKNVLIPELSNDGLNEQIRLFTEDYRRYKSFNQLNILLELTKEQLVRQEIELTRLENTNIW